MFNPIRLYPAYHKFWECLNVGMFRHENRHKGFNIMIDIEKNYMENLDVFV